MGEGFSELPEVEVRAMATNDLVEVASLHRLIFSDYFLTHMGQSFLKYFYREFIDQPGSYAFVAIYNNRIIGCIAGTTNSAIHYNRFYRRNFSTLALIAAKRFLLDSYIRNNSLVRLSHIKVALHSLFSRVFGQPVISTGGASSNIDARLLSIGVASELRRKGVANKLVDRFCKQLLQDGIELVGLSVKSNNDRAITFYEKTGWQRELITETAVYFRRSLV